MAAQHNLYIDQGADFSAEIGIYDDSNALWDLTGYSGAAKMKKSHIVQLLMLLQSLLVLVK